MAMSWFRAAAFVFAGWAAVCVLLPRLTNEIAGVGYVRSEHAEDWTQITGLFCIAFAILLNEAHRSPSPEVRRTVARGVLALAMPCAILMTYWQVIPERRWFRLDIADVILLYVIAYGMLQHAQLRWRRES